MSVSELSTSTQNYLKAIWSLSEWSSSPVTASLIAERTGLRLSSVSDAIRKLSAQGLLTHAPYGSVELTESGREFALAMVRRHRLLETFLVETLGYSWDQVHEEAEHLEHAVSDFMVEKIDELLGHPRRDPHGDPIPNPLGEIDQLKANQLSSRNIGQRVFIERISDSDPQLLQFFEEQGLQIGSSLEISAGPPFSDSLTVRPEGAHEGLQLGASAVRALFVSTEA